ncbi:hypothetical protein PVAND_016015 [Polypedilum vanderplanki]|uniref:Uncharacterized protein n=1 Tax=Polypedilum vanderplanki TaxID=319348 RepID=A0A9J6BEZ0_POLVA|nr:hypothetical protein PVAND_016015 [Polypedilum vanderplanki]
MVLKVLVNFLVLSLYIVELIEAGGGNAGAPNCWFYREHFNGSLDTYQKKVDAWVQHINDEEMVYVAKNPFQHPNYFNMKLDEIVENSKRMFDTYKKNILEETAILCGVNTKVINSALKSVESFNFPVYCLTNLGDVQKFYDEAIRNIENEKNEKKKH